MSRHERVQLRENVKTWARSTSENDNLGVASMLEVDGDRLKLVNITTACL